MIKLTLNHNDRILYVNPKDINALYEDGEWTRVLVNHETFGVVEPIAEILELVRIAQKSSTDCQTVYGFMDARSLNLGLNTSD